MNIKAIKEKVEQYDLIIIERHANPDGDAMGSQLGLKAILKENYPNKKIYAVGDTNNRFDFMGKTDEIDIELYEKALVFVLDSSTDEMLLNNNYKNANFSIKIDHHNTVSDYCDLNYTDTSFESCAGMIAQIALDLDWKINKEAATQLYTGIVTDSGRFRYDKTTARTFAIASKLMEYEIDIDNIYSNLYLESLASVKLKAKLINEFKITENKVAYLKVTKKDVEAYGISPHNIARGYVNIMAGIKEIEIWAMFVEDEENNQILCEFRSSKHNINQVAVKYGGGGHLLASGAKVASFEICKKIIEDFNKLVAGSEK
jgi:phosphoesterase RecJ-like protein